MPLGPGIRVGSGPRKVEQLSKLFINPGDFNTGQAKGVFSFLIIPLNTSNFSAHNTKIPLLKHSFMLEDTTYKSSLPLYR